MELIKYTLLAIKKWLLEEDNSVFLLPANNHEKISDNNCQENEKEEEEKVMISCYYFVGLAQYHVVKIKCAVNPAEKCLTCDQWRDKNAV